jgi:hypothetical protein
MLEAEGVVFDERGHCDLSVYQWSPRQRATQSKLQALRENKIGAHPKMAGKANTLKKTRRTDKNNSKQRKIREWK